MIPVSVIVYGIVASVIGAFGALYLKKGAQKFRVKRPINKNVFIGGALFVIGTVFFVLGLRNSPLSFFYPFTALLHLFTVLLGVAVLKEKVTRYRVLGMCCIMLGVILVSIGR